MKAVENNQYKTPECEVINLVVEENILTVSAGGGEDTGDEEI